MTEIYCCRCEDDVEARPSSGSEIYPHRRDLYSLAFWICPHCGEYVGCHPGGDRPLGNIPTKEMRQKRRMVHNVIDPLWKSGRFKRKKVYQLMAEKMGWRFHTAKTRSIEEVEAALVAAMAVRDALELWPDELGGGK